MKLAPRWGSATSAGWAAASSAAVVGIALGEEGRRALEQVVRGEHAEARLELGGEAVLERGVERGVEQALRLADGDAGRGRRSPRRSRWPWRRPRRRARPRGRGRSRAASSASSTLPVRISSLARARPTTRGRRCVPPAPGITARRTSGSPSFARADATRRSHASASSSPPPSALPSIAAIVGIGRAASRVDVRSSSSSRSRPPGPRWASNSPTCEPAENARSPAPVTTTARTSPGSAASSCASASFSSSSSSRVTRLSGGLTSVSRATRPSVELDAGSSRAAAKSAASPIAPEA